MKEKSAAEWLSIKQSYPIGHKFVGKVAKVAPFGIFVRIEPTQTKYWGLIDIGHYSLCSEDCKRLPLDYSQWLPEGSNIYCC